MRVLILSVMIENYF